MSELDALREWEKDTGKSASCPEGNAFIDGYRAGERAIAESQAPQPEKCACCGDKPISRSVGTIPDLCEGCAKSIEEL